MGESSIMVTIKTGDNAKLKRKCGEDDLYLLANATGNNDPQHLPDTSFTSTSQEPVILPASFALSIISTIVHNTLPGSGARISGQALAFGPPAQLGDELEGEVKVASQNDDGSLSLDVSVTNCSNNNKVLTGTVDVAAPAETEKSPATAVPGIVIQRHKHLEKLIRAATRHDPIPTAVVCPEEENSLLGAMAGMRNKLIAPVFLGNGDKIRETAKQLGEDISAIRLIETASDEEAAKTAVALANNGEVHALMKGHLHTDHLLHPVMDKETGLRTGRRITHVFVVDTPGFNRPLLLSDCAINIEPDLKTKLHITQNAITLASAIGIEDPKAAILSCVEAVNPKIRSSVDAAELAKLAKAGEITGGKVDGPLAMDNAIDLDAAKTKGIQSEVAGMADILIPPNLDAGNMLFKELAYVAGALVAGVVLGARVPIILNSRADGEMSRLASCAIASLAHNSGRFS